MQTLEQVVVLFYLEHGEPSFLSAVLLS